MTPHGDPTVVLSVLLDQTVILAAIREQLHVGGVELNAFPPAESRMPASSSVETAMSSRLFAVGVSVLIPEAALTRAVAIAQATFPMDLERISHFETQVRGAAERAVRNLGPTSTAKAEVELAIGYQCTTRGDLTPPTALIRPDRPGTA